jgi:hypothetical protein
LRRFRLFKNISAKVIVFDIFGKAVNSFKINNEIKYTFSTSNLSAGVYFIRVQMESEIKTIRLVKN